MCKIYQIAKYQFIYETYEILPNNPKKELLICEKCAVREYGSKNKKSFKDDFAI